MANARLLGGRPCLIAAICVIPAWVGAQEAQPVAQAANGAETRTAAVAAAPADDEANYRAAVADARAGRNDAALPVLQSLSERHPERKDIEGDYIVVLGWAGHDDQAVALADKVDRNQAPAYVLEGLAGSARRQKRYDIADSLYRKASERFPQRIEPRLGLVYVALDDNRNEEAARAAQQLKAAYPRDAAVLNAQGDVAAARGDWFAALAAYDATLKQQPENRDALQGKARALSRLGTPQLALELARAHPAAFSDADRQNFAADSTARRVRWGAAAANQGHGPQRFAELDRAIAESDAVGAKALDRNAALSPAERQVALDRVSALQARVRMRDAVDLYEAMAARPEPVPAYAKADAASAYLYLRQPEKARDLYREVVAADPANVDAQLGLFYALAESEDHKAALAQIEKLAVATPETTGAYSAVTTQPNPDYLRVQTARAQAPLLANNAGEAWRRLRDLHARAPANLEVDTAYASTMRARGWPRRADAELRTALTNDPYDSGALGEDAGARLEMNDFRGAEQQLNAGRAAAAEDQRVARAGRLWEVHNMQELDIEVDGGRSHDSGAVNAPAGQRDFEMDAHLYSKPFDYNYRAYLHGYTAQADFNGGTGRNDRAGVGLEYRSTRFSASGEVAQDFNKDRVAVYGTASYTPDDFWTFSVVGDTDSIETPLQARQLGVTAWRLGAGAAWRAHESRTIAVGYNHLRFSDGNERDIESARWTERVIKGPVYKLEVAGIVSSTQDTSTTAGYFNPRNDLDTSIQLANEWLQWRRYERAFRHRLIVTGGNYWQQGFGSGGTYDVRYEQEWTADDRLTVRYGIGESSHPYDGARSRRDYAYLALNVRF